MPLGSASLPEGASRSTSAPAFGLGRRPYGTTPPATTRPGRTQVRLALPEAHLLGPVNAPPTEPYAILPYGSAIQVNGEENHREAIAPFLARDGDCWVIATLHRSERDGTRAVKSLAEVRIDGAKVGVLTPKMSSENLPAVDFLAEQGAVAAVRARIKGNRIKAEVVLYCCRAHEISEDWFSRPVCAPNDWSPFRAEEDAREGANGRRLPSVRNRSVERPERTPVRLRQTRDAPAPLPPPDWYPDPSVAGQWPYWNGASWTVGAPGRNRTCDQVLRRHLLYPLSYGRG